MRVEVVWVGLHSVVLSTISRRSFSLRNRASYLVLNLG